MKSTLARREAVLALVVSAVLVLGLLSVFATKPVTFAGLVEAMRTWTRHWFELAELPNGAVA